MKRSVFLLFALSAFLFYAESASACQCVAPSIDTEDDFRAAVAASLDRADAVFSGEVIEVDRFTIKFSVRETWKGDFRYVITLVTGTFIDSSGLFVSSRCGKQFEVGKSYLVFAVGPEISLQAERCSWTGILEDSGRVVDELDRLKQLDTASQLSKANVAAFQSWRNLTTPSTLCPDSRVFKMLSL